MVEESNIALVLHALRYLIVMKNSNVKAMFATNKGKAVTLIIWKTGFGMETAMLVQGRVVRVRSKNMVHANDDGSYLFADNGLNRYLDSCN